MRIPPFALERYFARYEHHVAHVLCASDCETMTVAELLALDPGTERRLKEHRLAYSPLEGLDELREEIAGLAEAASAGDVMVTPGGGSSIELLLYSLLEPGDRVVVVTPCYQSHVTLPEVIGCRVTQVPLEETPDGWRLDLGRLSDAAGSGTKAVLVNFPHNPTGYLPDAVTWRETAAICGRAGARLISDEVFRFMEHEPGERLASAVDYDERAVVIGSMSKSFGLAGLRIGWLVTRDAGLREAVLGRLDYSAKDASAVSQVLTAAALRRKEPILKRNRDRALANLALLDAFIARHAARFAWHRPRAGVVASLRLVARTDAAPFCRDLLEARGVMLAPGAMFGMRSDYFRIGFGYVSFEKALAELEGHLNGEETR